MTAACPLFIGSIRLRTATQLAEAAIEAIAALPRRGRAGATHAYAVGIDVRGRVVVDAPDSMPPREWLMTCTYASDPDALADEIREEKQRRDGDGRRAA
jgi:hypothetical protein